MNKIFDTNCYDCLSKTPNCLCIHRRINTHRTRIKGPITNACPHSNCNNTRFFYGIYPIYKTLHVIRCPECHTDSIISSITDDNQIQHIWTPFKLFDLCEPILDASILDINTIKTSIKNSNYNLFHLKPFPFNTDPLS